MKNIVQTLLLLLVPLLAVVGLATAAAQEPAAEPAAAPAGDPYTLTTCPVSGEELGSMGDPIAVDLDGRAVQVCCKGCVGKLKADPAKYLADVDKALTAEQKPYYPLTRCIISGEPLVEDGKDIAVDVVVNNRLFQVCCKGCVSKLEKDSATHFATLDAAVVTAQKKDYPLETCAVREKSKLGAMGEPVDVVVGNRLVRFCCKGCKPKFDKDPATYLARVDAAWAPIHARKALSKPAKGDAHGHKDDHDHGKRGGR